MKSTNRGENKSSKIIPTSNKDTSSKSQFAQSYKIVEDLFTILQEKAKPKQYYRVHRIGLRLTELTTGGDKAKLEEAKKEINKLLREISYQEAKKEINPNDSNFNYLKYLGFIILVLIFLVILWIIWKFLLNKFSTLRERKKEIV